MNLISLLLHFRNEAFQKKAAVYMMCHSNSRWLDSMIQNCPSKTMLLISWSNCMAPRWYQSLAMWEVKRLGLTKIVEFHLHFKLTILFLGASTVQDSLQKPHIWGTPPFPPVFLLQYKRSFAPSFYIMQIQPKYEQTLTHLESHHKVEQQNIGGSYAHPWFKLR